MELPLRDITSRMVIGNVTVPFYLVMKPNPQVFRVNNEKVFNMSQTLGAWVTEHWGNKPEEIEVSGWTGRKVGDASDFAKVEFFKMRLEQLYKIDKERMVSILKTLDPANLGGAGISNVASSSKEAFTGNAARNLQTLGLSFILYRYTLYFGFFTNLVITEEIQYQRIYTYKFNFTVTFNTTDYLARNLLINFGDAAKIGLGGAISSLTQLAGATK
jgi:hypothetical protein